MTRESPPDEFSIVPVELGVNIIKHPRYFYAFMGDGYGSTTEYQNQMVIRLLQDYMENPSANYRDAIIRMLYDSLDNSTGTGDQPPEWNSDTESYISVATAKVSGTNAALFTSSMEPVGVLIACPYLVIQAPLSSGSPGSFTAVPGTAGNSNTVRCSGVLVSSFWME